jgi:hypothetical protein
VSLLVPSLMRTAVYSALFSVGVIKMIYIDLVMFLSVSMFTVTVGLWLRNVDPTSCSKEPVRSSVCISIGLSVCLFICCVSICVLYARVKCSAPSHFLFDMTLHSISAVHVRMRSKSYSKNYARHIVHAIISLFK